MTLKIAQDFVRLFGESAPPVPTSKEAFDALPMTQRETIRKELPAFVQALASDVATLPSAVLVRYEKGTLTSDDIPALRAAGLFHEIQKLEAQTRDRMVSKLSDDLANFRAARQAGVDNKGQTKAARDRARIASLNGFGGKVA